MAGLPEEIFRALLRNILTGQWPAGTRLPPERQLAADHNTNRNTLREAIRRLEQCGMVRVQQRSGVTVQDFREFGSLQLLPAFVEFGVDPQEKLRVVLDLLEPRAMLIATVANAAAQRASTAQMAELREQVKRLQEAETARDQNMLLEAEVAWATSLLRASQSLGLRWLLNPVMHATRLLLAHRIDWMIWDPSFAEMAAHVSTAIEAHNPDDARRAVTDYFDTLDETVRNLLRLALTADPPS